MSTHRNKFKNLDNTGFGPNSNVEGGRLTNKDGSTNLQKTGIPFWERISIYHTLIRMKAAHFFFYILLFYTIINLVFATVYFSIGVNHLLGLDSSDSTIKKFMEAFFFSSQTLTTVGYGHVAPSGLVTNAIASFESLIGILSFAVVTGLIYGRFARPKAYLLFSENMLISPFKDGRGLMMRVTTYKNNFLTDAEAIVTIAMHVEENGKMVTKFYQLPLQINKIGSLALSWTLVHPIDEESPMYQFTKDDFEKSRFEAIVAIKAFDDHFSNIVQQRTSYTYKELVHGARFLPMFQKSEDGTHTVLELHKINAFEPVTLPEIASHPVDGETVDQNS